MRIEVLYGIANFVFWKAKSVEVKYKYKYIAQVLQ